MYANHESEARDMVACAIVCKTVVDLVMISNVLFNDVGDPLVGYVVGCVPLHITPSESQDSAS